ncbi:ferrochelatase [Cryptosporangium phraense]|uniref:Coproporphyrin III ferrochelatase n=1 Tax=Cryptosporangium phraense TaxID=2593070 RepID=A0A545AF74_9ACTN|nr:ferrochelatase [Cryptosporangium phraense]TQS39910.1 ferrochelatase [Cryptosporangium phraense]
MSEYDAVLLLSFGGPEGPDDVMPFLENVVRGRGVPAARLAEVAEHYHHFGGVSPINQQNRDLLAALRIALDEAGIDLPLYWGNRNWHPMLADTLRQMRADGVRRALGFATSAYSSYSSCRQYRDDIEVARLDVGPDAPEIEKLRHFYDHPGFVEPHVDAVKAALGTDRRATTRIVFTAHSIPTSMNDASGPDGGLYRAQLRVVAGLVSAAAAPDVPWDLVWQSRSGPPQVPWLEPDVNDHLRALAKEGVTDVVISPIGFVSDHLEVVWDLDNEARETAAELGLGFARAATPGTDPRFVSMMRELVEERLYASSSGRRLAPWDGSGPSCRPGCCPAPVRRPAN